MSSLDTSHPVVTMAGTESTADAGSFALPWLSFLIKNQSGQAGGTWQISQIHVYYQVIKIVYTNRKLSFQKVT